MGISDQIDDSTVAIDETTILEIKGAIMGPKDISEIIRFNPRTYTQLIPPPWYNVGGRVDGTPLGFRYVTILRKVFSFSNKPVMCSTR